MVYLAQSNFCLLVRLPEARQFELNIEAHSDKYAWLDFDQLHAPPLQYISLWHDTTLLRPTPRRRG
jgi:hypothetical protein